MFRIKRTLLIEDDEITSYLNKTIIENTGLVDELVFATNGQEAIDYLRQIQDDPQLYPELILLDINMPILDGFGFLTEVKQLFPAFFERSKVVALTTSSHPQDIAKMKELGATICLVKPLTEAAFTEVVLGMGVV